MTTLHELNRKAATALQAVLGPVDYIRYTQQFSTGSGDYTAERQRRTEESIESISERVKELTEKGLLQPPPNAKVLE